MQAVHRYMYKMFVGPLEDGVQANHRCDNALCVNPDHLYAGTQMENMKDMHSKGRDRSRGERNFSATLTDAEAIAILQRYTGKRGEQAALAREYGCKSGVICQLVNRHTWKHLESQPDSAGVK